jgi:hypothetical protein
MNPEPGRHRGRIADPGPIEGEGINMIIWRKDFIGGFGFGDESLSPLIRETFRDLARDFQKSAKFPNALC